MTKGLIDTLLEIGNVETNPGPTVEKKEVVDEILTLLISTVPNDEMKRLFAKITTLNNKNELYTLFGTMRVPKLINIAAYVHSWDNETRKLIRSSLKKDGIVDLIVKRLRALDPVICSSSKNFAKTEPLKYSTINNP